MLKITINEFFPHHYGMRAEQAYADVELSHKGKHVKLKALVNTGASTSVISLKLAHELGAFSPIEKPYELKTADRGGRIRIIGRCSLGVVFQGVEVPGGAAFEIAENLREGLDLVIGRPEIDKWDIVFTPEGPKPKKVPIELELI